MRRIENIGIFFAVMFLCGAMVIVNTIPVYASYNNNDEYHELVKEAEEEVQGLSLAELDEKLEEVSEEIDEAIVDEEGSLSSATGDALEYATDEEVALLEALNKEKSDLIMLEGTTAGAKYDGEYESSIPVNINAEAVTVIGDIDLAKNNMENEVVNLKTVRATTSLSASAPKMMRWSYYFYSDSNGWDGAGDIFISTYTSLHIFDMGHAALGGDTKSTTIEILGGGKKVEWLRDNWFTPRGGGLYEANRDNGAWAWYRVRGASVSQYQAAKNYAHNKILGAPYNWNFYDYSSSWAYYCSEVVHFAWLRGAGKFVSNGLGNMQIAPYGLGPQNKYNATYLYRGDLSSKGGNR